MNDACAASSPSARRMTETAWIRLSSVTATSRHAAAMSSSFSTTRCRLSTRYVNASSARGGNWSRTPSRHSFRAPGSSENLPNLSCCDAFAGSPGAAADDSWLSGTFRTFFRTFGAVYLYNLGWANLSSRSISPGTKQEHGHVETGVVDSGSRRGRRRVVGDVGRPAAGAARGRRRHRRRRHRWHGDERAGARGRRLGDCRDHGHAHEAPQDRRDRRPGPLPAARPADQGQLQRLGPRIRPGGLGARAGHAGEKPGVDGARGA